jgi:hypothetical protein
MNCSIIALIAARQMAHLRLVAEVFDQALGQYQRAV